MKKMLLLTALGAALLSPVAADAGGFNKNPSSARLAEPSRVGEAATKTRFAKSIEDLPIMPGLELMEDKDVLFIFGTDRIAQTTLAGRVDVDEVYYFYRSSLPQLGWKPSNGNTFERNGERLRLDASAANAEGVTYVRFEVEPLKR